MSIPITEYRNAVSLNDDNTRFEVEINHPEYGWIPYHLNPDDTDNTINNDELLTLIGSDFTNETQEAKDERQIGLVRLDRDFRLRNEVDPILSNSVRFGELTTEQQNAWKQYRIDLLNVPQQDGFPHNVTFPTKPG